MPSEIQFEWTDKRGKRRSLRRPFSPTEHAGAESLYRRAWFACIEELAELDVRRAKLVEQIDVLERAVATHATERTSLERLIRFRVAPSLLESRSEAHPPKTDPESTDMTTVTPPDPERLGELRLRASFKCITDAQRVELAALERAAADYQAQLERRRTASASGEIVSGTSPSSDGGCDGR